ncbi:hypothetical protein ABZ477_06315 [Microbacterium sp. NPDC019599]|uniref:hypothetical protein n=1 Tax=Microbacterium sp. NPDC019599 TaxID=3154690 RepID=UPI0033FB1ABE
MREDDRDLPEGVIDANPAGGWEDGRKADGATDELSDDLEDASVTDGWTADIPMADNAAGSARRGADPVESDVPTQGADPDLAADPDDEED